LKESVDPLIAKVVAVRERLANFNEDIKHEPEEKPSSAISKQSTGPAGRCKSDPFKSSCFGCGTKPGQLRTIYGKVLCGACYHEWLESYVEMRKILVGEALLHEHRRTVI
jgi:hypothetical protein